MPDDDLTERYSRAFLGTLVASCAVILLCNPAPIPADEFAVAMRQTIDRHIDLIVAADDRHAIRMLVSDHILDLCGLFGFGASQEELVKEITARFV